MNYEIDMILKEVCYFYLSESVKKKDLGLNVPKLTLDQITKPQIEFSEGYFIEENWIKRWKDYVNYEKIVKLIETNNWMALKYTDIVKQIKNYILSNNLFINVNSRPEPMRYPKNYYNMINGLITFKEIECFVDDKMAKNFISHYNVMNRNIKPFFFLFKQGLLIVYDGSSTFKFIYLKKNLLNFSLVLTNYINNDFPKKVQILKEHFIKCDAQKIKEKFIFEGIEKMPIETQSNKIIYVTAYDDNVRLANLKNEIEKSQNDNKPFFQNKIFNMNNIGLVKKHGLKNIGLTCYMNSVIQCLASISELTLYFLNSKLMVKLKEEKTKFCLSHNYILVLCNLFLINENENVPFSPNEFKKILSLKNPLFAGITAADSKDLLIFLLESFHNELNEYLHPDCYNNYTLKNYDNLNQRDFKQVENAFMELTNRHRTIITDLFYVIERNSFICFECNTLIYTLQGNFMFEFLLENVYNNKANKNINCYNQNCLPSVNPYDCFDYYTSTKVTDNNNLSYCQNCQKNTKTKNKVDFYWLPNYLILVMSKGKGGLYKCNIEVIEYLDLSKYFQGENKYFRLKSVIFHIGVSGDSGHFFAETRNRVNEKIMRFDDSKVTELNSFSENEKNNAYILFYEKVDFSIFEKNRTNQKNEKNFGNSENSNFVNSNFVNRNFGNSNFSNLNNNMYNNMMNNNMCSNINNINNMNNMNNNMNMWNMNNMNNMMNNMNNMYNNIMMNMNMINNMYNNNMMNISNNNNNI